MKICFVVRNIAGQLPTFATSHLAYEAYRLGHTVAMTSLDALCWDDSGGVVAPVVCPPKRQAKTLNEFLFQMTQPRAFRGSCPMDSFDVIFLRYNPLQGKARHPILEFSRLLKSRGVMVVNDPSGLEKAASKLYLMSFPESIRAKTLVTKNPDAIKVFLKDLDKPAIIKPLSGFGGADVFLIREHDDVNLNQTIAAVLKSGFAVVQEFLEDPERGDKRLLLLDGEPITVGDQVAIYRRVCPEGDIRANIHIGGTRRPTSLTENERKIVSMIRAKLKSDGLYLVGADLVGEKLLELNVFCPGGIRNINELYGINVGEVVIRDLEKRSRIWGASTARTLSRNGARNLRDTSGLGAPPSLRKSPSENLSSTH